MHFKRIDLQHRVSETCSDTGNFIYDVQAFKRNCINLNTRLISYTMLQHRMFVAFRNVISHRHRRSIYNFVSVVEILKLNNVQLWYRTEIVEWHTYEIVGHELWIVDIAPSCCCIFFVYLHGAIPQRIKLKALFTCHPLMNFVFRLLRIRPVIIL